MGRLNLISEGKIKWFGRSKTIIQLVSKAKCFHRSTNFYWTNVLFNIVKFSASKVLGTVKTNQNKHQKQAMNYFRDWNKASYAYDKHRPPLHYTGLLFVSDQFWHLINLMALFKPICWAFIFIIGKKQLISQPIIICYYSGPVVILIFE